MQLKIDQKKTKQNKTKPVNELSPESGK